MSRKDMKAATALAESVGDEHIQAFMRRLDDEALMRLLASLIDRDAHRRTAFHYSEIGRERQGASIGNPLRRLFKAAHWEYMTRTRAPTFDADEKTTLGHILEVREHLRPQPTPRYATTTDVSVLHQSGTRQAPLGTAGWRTPEETALHKEVRTPFDRGLFAAACKEISK